MARVELEKVSKIYPGGIRAVNAIDLQIKDQEFEREIDFLDAVEMKIEQPPTEALKVLLLKYAGPEAVDHSITFPIAGVGADDYFLRIQVDGAESVLQVNEDQNSPTYGQILGPKVTIP